MTCKDCIHYEAHSHFAAYFGFDDKNVEQRCPVFQDKSKIIELPCKVGDTVYQTDGIRIYESRIKTIVFDSENIAFDKSAIGKTVFLTKEEAEIKLKELNEND